MASGVDPINRLSTNTRAPGGRDCTLMLPAPLAALPLREGAFGGALLAGAGTESSSKLVAAVARRAANCTRRCPGA